jgi:hypothetical protein
MRLFLVWITIACCVGAALLVRPRRYEIDGLSMAPALLPGDVVSTGWFPQADRWSEPRRFDRWLLTAPDGVVAVKRVVGRGGETVGFVEGDLAIDGEVLLTPPWVLAQVAAVVVECGLGAGVWQRSFQAETVWDEAPFASGESRRLTACRDIGIAAIIAVDGSGPLDVAACVGSRAIRWSFALPGRYAVVAGRLDRHLVAAAWSLPRGPASGPLRSPLPPDPPRSWSVAEEWVDGGEAPPALGLSLMRDGVPLSMAECGRLLESCGVWRDMVHCPPASGTTEWHVDDGAVFVLGDFPAGSRDSRHWGPLPTAALWQRIDHHSGELSSSR